MVPNTSGLQIKEVNSIHAVLTYYTFYLTENNMKTIKEISVDSSKDYVSWYEDAVKWILKDIQEAAAISVLSIEVYLQDLLKE